MAKMAYFKFYPTDWLADPVTACSPLAERLWFRMILVMHECEPRGHLSLAGKPMDERLAAKRCGVAKLSDYRRLLAELERAGVAKRTSDGCVFSSRMDADTKRLEAQNERQRRSRNSENAEETADYGDACHADVTAMSRGSHAHVTGTRARLNTRSQKPEAKEQEDLSANGPRDTHPGGSFERFWEAYPKRVKRPDALKAFAKALAKTDADTIIAGVERAKYSRQWTDQGGKYIPHAATWLNGEQWLDEPTIAPVVVVNTNRPGNLRADDWEDSVDAQ